MIVDTRRMKMNMKAIIPFCFVLSVIGPTVVHTTPVRGSVIPGSTAPTSMKKSRMKHVSGQPCPVYHYHDHGTDYCEFCCDICCQAKVKGTTKQCNSQCPKYARKLEEDAQKVLDSEQRLPESGPGQSTGQQTPAWNLPLSAQIAIPLAVLLLLLFLLGLVHSRRHTLAGLFRQWKIKRATPAADTDPALEPLGAESVQPDTDSRQLDTSLEGHPQLSPRSSSSSSSRALLAMAVGPPSSFSAAAAAALQTASYRHPSRGQPQPLGSAVPESPEGREGHDLQVFPSSRAMADAADTEVKTFHGSQVSLETTV